MNRSYSVPLNRLLTYGDCRNWPNYQELGLTQEYIPELIRMATDEELNWADPDSLEVWAPIHAWRALGQLRAEEAREKRSLPLWEWKKVQKMLPQQVRLIDKSGFDSKARSLFDILNRCHSKIFCRALKFSARSKIARIGILKSGMTILFNSPVSDLIRSTY